MWRGVLYILLAMILQAQHHSVAAQPSSYDSAAQNAGARSPVGKQPSAQEYKPSCEKPKNGEESELCAQWGGVAAAREGNRLTAEANRGLGYAKACVGPMLT